MNRFVRLSSPPTREQKRMRAAMLLTRCTPERLATLTAEEVAEHSGCSLKTAREMLERRRGE